MPLCDLNEFLRLSEVLNLQLSVTSSGGANIASVIMHRKILPKPEWDILLKVLSYLVSAYGQRRRRLGPLAVLHPLRATALLARAQKKLTLLDLLTCLAHDKLEDLTPVALGETQWNQLETGFLAMLKSIDPKDEWYLMERLEWLTRKSGHTYFQYIQRLLSHASSTPELVRIKLADRLDNTLDMHVELEDPMQGIDFFATIFQILFVSALPEHKSDLPHPPSSPLSGAERLYQLFKTMVLLSMVRQKKATDSDETALTLFQELAMASLKEAQRIVLHIFEYHQKDRKKQRAILLDVMTSAQNGAVHKMALPRSEAKLQGLFITRFREADSTQRKESLAQMYQDKELMVEAALAFIIIFQSFLVDPQYYVHGITNDTFQGSPPGGSSQGG